MKICGAWTGPTVPGDQANPKGYFENLQFRKLVAEQEPTIQKVIMLIRKKADKFQPWLLKHPALLSNWRQWHSLFPGARWILVRRPKENIEKSIRNCGFLKASPPPVENYLKQMEKLKLEPGLWWREVHSDKLIQHANRSDLIKHLIVELGLTWHPEKVNEFIEPNYWHY